MKILVSEIEDQFIKHIKTILSNKYQHVDVALNGKDAQLKGYKERYRVLILALETENFSGLQVLKYFKINSPSTRVILTVKSKKVIEEIESISRFKIRDFGVNELLVKPFSDEQLFRAIEGKYKFQMSEDEKLNENNELLARDDEFTKIEMDSLLAGAVAVFDYYIKLGVNKYLKIVHKGESLTLEQVTRFAKENIQYLYFKTKDRGLYIYYLNKIVKRFAKMNGVSPEKKVKIIKEATTKLVEDIYQEGIREDMVEEGMELCENTYRAIQASPSLKKLMGQLLNMENNIYNHSFLVVFFAGMVAHRLGWEKDLMIKKLSMGAIFHDIGKIKLDPLVISKPFEELSGKQKELYLEHPTIGVEVLKENGVTDSAVHQIVYQHHELMDGTGFPKGTTGMKIFPLAQIIGFVDLCANEMLKKGIKPIDALKNILADRETIVKYNQKAVKAFTLCFVEGEIEDE